MKAEENFNKKDLADYKSLSIATKSVIDSALERNIGVEILDEDKNIGLSKGKIEKRFYTSVTSDTDPVAIRISKNKISTYIQLSGHGVPVPDHTLVDIDGDVVKAAEKIGFPVVIKPAKGTHGGDGVFANIKDAAELEKVFKITEKISREYESNILVEKYHSGKDFRVLLVDYKLIHAIERVPAFVIGDGKNSIKQLINLKNKDPLRGDWYNSPLRIIKIDDEVKRILSRKKMTPGSILPAGRKIFLRKNANISMGGEAFDVTNDICKDTCRLLEKVARVIGLNIIGVDIICKDIRRPLTKNNGVIIEVNQNPGFAGHVYPTKGKPCNPGKYVIDMMFGK
ncbi:MAG: ATP-grasp domain-containing protein [Parcubacteria group bacterium]|nr:ATP-grasp domain-containing protein [Parcubacteria group bacterium]